MSITKEYNQLQVYGLVISEGISIQAPIGSPHGYRFPTSDGTPNQVLATNGAGQLTFQNATSLALTTDDVPEGLTNLYFTNERVDDRIAALIQNGIGINWTYDDPSNTFTGNVTLAPFTTDDLTEGSTNLYFTNEKVDDRVAQLIINGTGLTWTYDDAANTLQGVVSLSPFNTDDLTEGSTNLYFTNEAAQDAVAAMMQNGTGISFVYNDIANTLTPTVTLAPFTTDDLAQGASNLYLTNEAIDDRVAALVQNTSTVTWTYNDVANTLSADASSIVKVQRNGALIGSRDTINFIEGTDIHLSVADDAVNSKVNVTVSYNGVGGGGDTYDLNATQAGSDVQLNLTSGSGTDNSLVKLSAGSNITLTQNSSTEVTIASSGGGGGGGGDTSALGDRVTNIMHTSIMWAYSQTETPPWQNGGDFYVGVGSKNKMSPGWNDQYADGTSGSAMVTTPGGAGTLGFQGGQFAMNVLIPMPVKVRAGDQIKICMNGYLEAGGEGVNPNTYQVASGFHGTNCPAVAAVEDAVRIDSTGYWGSNASLGTWTSVNTNGTFCQMFLYTITEADVSSDDGMWLNEIDCKNLFGFGVGWNQNVEGKATVPQKASFSLRADYISKYPYETGKIDVKFVQDAEDSKKYDVQVKSKDQEVSLKKFELDANTASGARIASAGLKTEVFNTETWTSTVIANAELKGANSDWTVNDSEGNPNPATLPLNSFVSGATINFDAAVNLLAEEIQNQVWTTSTGAIIPSSNITVSVELAASEEGEKEGK